jgi:hypothetical protein
VKTVPTVQLADPTDTAGLLELPDQVRLALGDIAGAAREGLLAMAWPWVRGEADHVRSRDHRGGRPKGKRRHDSRGYR